jgi:hypothetical protein
MGDDLKLADGGSVGTAVGDADPWTMVGPEGSN